MPIDAPITSFGRIGLITGEICTLVGRVGAARYATTAIGIEQILEQRSQAVSGMEVRAPVRA